MDIARAQIGAWASVSSLAIPGSDQRHRGVPVSYQGTAHPRDPEGRNQTITTIATLLAAAAYDRADLDRFLDADGSCSSRFDPVVGAIPRSQIVRDGMNGYATVYNFARDGQRLGIHYAGRPCRINTYGNSYTMCHQVSDGETWQEVLAAHLGEPIRNFGVGGHSVYQAFRIMQRIEAGEKAAGNIILNVFSDDHSRNLCCWRGLHQRRFREAAGATRTGVLTLPAPPSAFIRYCPGTQTFAEADNPFPTPQSLYQLCDGDFICDFFADHLETHIYGAIQGAEDVDVALLAAAADRAGLRCDFGTREAICQSAKDIIHGLGVQASRFVLDRVVDFTAQRNRNLLVLCSYWFGDMRDALSGKPRFYQAFLDHLVQAGLRHIDTLPAHLHEFAQMRCDLQWYFDRYWAGHYNPTGNHFFAFAIKDAVVAMLDPKPLAYGFQGEPTTAMAGMLNQFNV